jgi:hypothetical protein
VRPCVGFVTVTQARLFCALVSCRPAAGVSPTSAQLVNGGYGAEPSAVATMSMVPRDWFEAVGPVPEYVHVIVLPADAGSVAQVQFGPVAELNVIPAGTTSVTLMTFWPLKAPPTFVTVTWKA